MSKVLKLCFVAILACVCQTNLSQVLRIAGVAPDLLIVFLVLLTSYTGAYGGFCTGWWSQTARSCGTRAGQDGAV